MVVVGASIPIYLGSWNVMGTILTRVTTTPGINLFMSLYGLTVFLETPEPQRKGRKRYIVASFVITVLFSFGASLDMANYFQSLFKSTSPSHWYELLLLNVLEWKYRVGYTVGGLFIAVGDALLVGAVPNLRLSGNTHGTFVAGVSLLYHLRGI
jgi:hypothetical protein